MIPKAELHVHIEGAIPPSKMQKIAKKNGTELPAEIIGANDTYKWSGFPEFLKVYDIVASFVKTPEDYYEIIYWYLKQSANQGVIYSEIILSPDLAAKNNISYENLVENAVLAAKNAKKDFGIECRFLMVGIKHYGIDSINHVVDQVITKEHPYVVGINLAGDEVNYPNSNFEKVIDKALRADLNLSIHAGEVAGADSIFDALNFPIHRLGHGIRCLEDKKLIDIFLKRNIHLEICPSSNIGVGVFSSFSEYPLRKLFDMGVNLSLNSDDPPYFGTNIANEYAIAKTHFGFTDLELCQLTKNAINASFIDAESKKELLEKIKC